jgi:hypothetical protein
MSIFDDAREATSRSTDDASDAVPITGTATASAADDERAATVKVAGEDIELDEIETQQPDEDGNWLAGTDAYGRPRGVQAIENRQIVQTSAMQAIVNGIASNIVGGDLTFEADDQVIDQLSDREQAAAEDTKALIRDVLTGPHLQDETLDDLIVAAVEDMVGPGEGVWQLLEPAESDLPVAALTTLDPLTVRKNVDRHGQYGDPPVWQASGAFGGGGIGTFQSVNPVPLQQDDVAFLRYPLGNRSYEGPYPVSPAWQVREWLEILANSTTHHNRFYSDSEIPPGVLSFMETGAGVTVDEIKQRLEDASGDPRDVPVIEGSAQWLDLGGTAVNLNIIEEQRWFFFLCLGSLGLGKQELGFVEDVNRSNGEVEATRVYKRVTGPFINQFERAMKHVAEQFDSYNRLGQPFTPTISFSDPRQEHAERERLRKDYQSGALSLRQYVRRRGDSDLAEDDDRYRVEIAGETVDYGDHPKWVAERLLSAAAGEEVDVDGEPDESPDSVTGDAGGA